MTDEERIKSILSECKHNFISYDNLHGYDENFQPEHGIRIIKEALNKTISKEPYFEGDGYYDGELVMDTWICPCCEKSFEVDYEEYDYCPECGQHIDWSKENE